VGGLVGLLWNGVADAADAQQAAVGPGAVALVGDEVVRAGARSSRAGVGHLQRGQQRGEHPAVVHVAGGQQHDQQPPRPSATAWILVVSPPRERPIA
jgi:hypothetical protein